jgi:LDH2 family malate/lactate/ureidoglycolate dehydrogenase
MMRALVRQPSLARVALARSLCTRPDTVQIPIEEARSVTAAALRKLGWDDHEASLQAEIMLGAELCGNNQGLVKMYQPTLMAPAPGAKKPTIERDTPSSAVVNGNGSPGMLAAVAAADLAADKVTAGADAPAIAIVGTHGTSTSSGQLGYYAKRMATRGVIGICMANSPEFVAAAPGGKAVFGTNPIAVGVPTTGAPLTFDMATSAIALYGALTAKAKGEPLPPGVAYGRDGGWTTDASEALDGGAIATFGGCELSQWNAFSPCRPLCQDPPLSGSAPVPLAGLCTKPTFIPASLLIPPFLPSQASYAHAPSPSGIRARGWL